MSAQSALDALLDPSNKLENTFVIPEGTATVDALPLISEGTGIPLEELQAAAAEPPANYGLPAEATILEGFLFPATYTLDPDVDAHAVLQTLVDRQFEALDAAGVAPADRWKTIVLAALVQREAGLRDDFYKVARVFLNRLDPAQWESGLLQSDATVAYGTGNTHLVTTTDAERADAGNPYNTYVHPGLPIGPDLEPRRPRHRRGGASRRRSVVVLRDVEPRHGRDDLLHDRRRARGRGGQVARVDGRAPRVWLSRCPEPDSRCSGRPSGTRRVPPCIARRTRGSGSTGSTRRSRCDGGHLAGFLDGLDASWRGLSLTMPLKQDVLPLLDDIDEVARLTGAANTVLFDGTSRRGFNTDVGGIVRALAESDAASGARGVIVGAGATALSALVAMSQLGARDVRVLVRRARRVPADRRARPATRARRRRSAARGAGRASTTPISSSARCPEAPTLGVRGIRALVSAAPLLDVAYDPWPTALGASWLEGGGRVVHGLGHAAAPGAAAGAHLRERRSEHSARRRRRRCSPSCATPCVDPVEG